LQMESPMKRATVFIVKLAVPVTVVEAVCVRLGKARNADRVPEPLGDPDGVDDSLGDVLID